MSKLIGQVVREDGKVLVYVSGSLGGVEVLADNQTRFSPAQARQYAALLLAAVAWVNERRRITRAECSGNPEMQRVNSITQAEMDAWGDL